MGCSARDEQAKLLRVLCEPDGKLALVVGRQHKGRSGYLHPSKECCARFAARKGSLRSLRRNVDRAARAAFVEGLKLQDAGVMRG
jgi:predicted RNA-binding protein YlxR (DUF448 family)